MKPRGSISGSILIVIVAVILAASCSSQGKSERDSPAAVAPTALGGKELLEARCSACHDIGKVTNERGTAEQWAWIVNGMISRGAKLNDAEKDVLISYLAKTYGG